MKFSSAFRSLCGTLLFLLLANIPIDTWAAPPRAHHLYISGTTSGANPATFSAMEVGFTLRVWYTYADNDGNAESGTTFQWYTYTSELGTGKTAIAGATASTFTLTAAEVGLFISVEVNPRNATDGFGTTVEFRPWDATRVNSVLAAGSSCNKAGGGTVGPANNLDTSSPLCSPRATSWEVTYTGIDYAALQGPRISIDWEDGGGFQTFTPSLINNLLTQSDTFNLVAMPNQLWRTSQLHTYDYAGGSAASAAPDRCTYQLRAVHGRQGLLCVGSPQIQPFTVWDKEDNTTLGTLDVNHTPATGGVEVGEVTNICEKDQTAIRVQDASTFNCTNPLETVRVNDEARWVQFVYGTTSTVTTGAGATEKIVINGVSYTSANLPIYGRVTYQAAATTAPLPAITDDIIMPTTGLNGQTFVITMRSWNTCNKLDRIVADGGFNPNQSVPFNVFDITRTTSGVGTDQPGLAPLFPTIPGPAIYANTNPVTRIYTIAIITKPPAPVSVDKDFCSGTVLNPPTVACGAITAANQLLSFELTAASVPGSTVINWYFGNPNSGGVFVTNNYGTNCRFFRPGSLAGTGAQGTMRTAMFAGTPGVYSVWATYQTANGCTSDPVEAKLTVRPSLAKPVAPAGAANVCNGSSSAFTLAAPADQTIPINTITNGAPVTFQTQYLWSASGTGVTFTPNPDITGSNSVAFAIAPEPSPSVTRSIGAAVQYRTQTTSLSNCTTAAPNNNLTVTIFGISDGGTISPSPTICNGSATGNMTAAGTRGAILQWERSFNAGAFVAIAGTAGLTTFSEAPPNGSGTYKYRVLVQNQNAGGPCASATTLVANQNTVTVNPVPVQPTITPSGVTTFCFGGSVTLSASNLDGNAATYRWYRNGGNTGVTANNIVLTTVAQSGSYTVEAVGIGSSFCVSPLSAAVPVLINALPTASNPTGGGSVCAGTPAPDIVWTLTGTAPFNFTITRSVEGPLVVAGHMSTTYTIVGPAPPSTQTYQITSLTDANGCSATSMGGMATVTTTPTPPPSVETFTATAAVCDVGAGTNPPDAILDLLPNSAQTYDISYTVNGVPFTQTGLVSSASGLLTISPPYTAWGSAPGSYVVTVTALTNTLTLCAGAVPFNSAPLVVNATPAVTNGQVKTICGGGAVNLEILMTPANSPAGTMLSWPDPDGAGPATAGNVAADPAGTLHITDVLTNTTGANATVTYVVTPTSSAGCPGTPRNVVITVNPTPVITAGQVKTICSGAAVNHTITLTPAGLPAGTTFSWPDPDGAGPATARAFPGTTAQISDVLTNTTGADIIVTYTVTPRGPGGALGTCSGTVENVTITVQPVPVIVAGQIKTICSGEAVNKEILLTPLNLPAGTVFNWPAPTLSAGGAQGIAGVNVAMGIAGTNHIVDVLTNTTGSPITATYFVTPSAPMGGCAGTMQTVVVTVNPAPVVTAGQTKSICSGQAVNKEILLSPANLPASTEFNWPMPTMSAGAPQGTPGVGVLMGAAGTNHILDVLTNTTSAPITATYAITPSSTITGCIGAPVNVVITINPLPVANPIGGPGTACVSPTNIILYQVTPNAGSTYTWTIPSEFTVFGGGGTSSPNFFVLLSFPTVDPGKTITVVETNSYGCVGPANNLMITVAAAPGALSINGPLVVCKSQTGINYSVPAGIFNPTSTYNWSAVGATIVSAQSGVGLQTITVDFGLLVSADISLNEVSASGCSGTPVTITVAAADRPVMTSGITQTICSGNAPSLVFTSAPLVPSTFNWTVINITGAVTGTTLAANGTGSLSDVLTNVSGFTGSVTYRVTPVAIAAPNCTGATQDVIITVNPEPILVTPQLKTICSGAATNYEILLNPLTLPAGTMFTWPAPVMSDASVQGSASPGSVAGGPNGTIHINDVLNNTGTTSITATYTITPTSGAGCPGTPRTVVIQTNPEPVMLATLNTTVCSDQSTGVMLGTEATSVAAAGFNITSRTIQAGLTPSASNAVVTATGVAANYLAGDIFTNTGSIPGTVTYTIVPVSAAGCAGDPLIVTVTINPKPVVLSTLDATHCSGEIAGPTLNTNGTSVAAANYNITGSTVAAGLIADAGNAVIPAVGVANTYLASDTFINPTAGPLNVTYTVVPVSAGGCLGDAVVITMIINPEPIISPLLDATRCSDVATGLTLTTNGTSVAAANYNLTARTIDAGLIPGGANAVVPVNGVAGGYLSADRFNNTGTTTLFVTYTVVPVSAAGCLGEPVVITITIEPEPVVANGLDAALCSDLPTALTLNTNGTSVVAAAYNVTGRSIGAGLTANGGNAAVPASGVADNYLAADAFTNITTAAAAVTYTVVPVSAAGCTGDAKVITITINPESVFPNSFDASRCSDVAIGLTLTTTPTSAVPANFNITSIVIDAGLIAGGGNAIVPAPGVPPNYLASDVFTNPGTVPLTVVYTAVPVTAAGCLGDAKTITFTIGAEPVGVDDTKTICSDFSVTYNLQTNVNTLGNGFASNFSWIAAPNASVSGESTTIQGGQIITDVLTNVTNIDQLVVYTVTPVGTNGCSGNPFTVMVTVQPKPVGVNDIATINSDIILNYDLQNNVNTLGNNLGATFTWIASINSNVGGESTTAQPGALITDVLNNVTNSNQTVTYTIVPTSLTGCLGNPLLLTVTVLPEPKGFNDAVTVNSDVNINYNLQNNVNSGGNSVPATFVWQAVDNPLVTGESLAPQASGSITDVITNTTGVDQVIVYTVVPTGTNGVVGDSFTITVTIRSEPVGGDDALIICSDIPVTYNLQNNINTFGNGQASTIAWFAAPNPNVTGESTTLQSGAFISDALNNVTSGDELILYTVTPTGTNGASGNTFQISVTVRPEPVVASNLNETKCSGGVYGKMLATNGTSIAAANFDVTVVSIDAGITGGRPLGLIGGGGSAANVLMADSYTNTTSVPLTVVYSVVPNGTNGCIGNAQLVVFTINPEPVLLNPGFPAVCSTNTSVTNIVNIVLGTNGTSVAASTYQLMNIQYSNGGPFGAALPPGLSANASNAISGVVGSINLVKNDRYTNTSAIAVTVRYTIQGTSASGCISALLDYDIVINPEPNLDPLLSPTPVCSGVGSNVTLGVAAGSVAASTYNINSILFPGLTAGGSNTGIGSNKPANAIFNDVYINTTNGVLTATYQISPISAAGCVGPEGTVTLTINPSPDLSNTLNRTVCINSAGGILFTTTATSVPASSFNLISVTPQPLLVAGGGNVAPANGVASNYISADQWSNPTNGPLTVTYRVAPVSGAPCVGPEEDIVLTIEPTITATPVSLKPTVCSGSSNGNDPTDIEMISPTNPSSGVITFNYTALSSIGTGITGFVPALSGLAEGYKITDNLVNNSNSPATVTYSITPVASGAASGVGCTGLPATIIVTVQPKPKLAVPSVKTVCEGVATAMSLTSTTTPSAGTIEFLLVTATPSSAQISGASPNGTVFANGGMLNDVLSNNSSFAETMTYTFRPRYNGGAGCIGDDVITVVTVNPRPTVTPSAQLPICNGDVIDITLATDVASTVPIWTASPQAGVTGASNGAGDRIFQILFNNTTGIGPLTVDYAVTPTAAGCSGTPVNIIVTVNPLAKVTGTPPTATVCHGTALNVPLSSNVTAGVNYDWTIVDSSSGGVGGTAVGPGTVINQVLTNITGAQATLTYTITPTGPGPGAGCVGQDKLMIVTVSPEITASWLNTPSPDFICNGSTEYLVLNLGGRAPFSFTYNDGGAPIVKTGQPPVAVLPHTPAVTTTYALTSVTDGLGCVVPFNVPFVVNVGDTDPNYTIVDVPVASCSPNEITFQYNQVAGTIYTWRFGDSGDSVYTAAATVPNKRIKHTYTNLSPTSTLSYPATMQTELPAPFPGCFKTTPAKIVTIYPNPILNVVPSRTEICSGESITFTNSSVGTAASTIQWAFRVQGQVPETVMGTTFNMTYGFTNVTTNPITYEVIFRATNSQGCAVPDVIMPIQVYRASVANFSEGAVPQFINGESLVTFTNTSSILDAGVFRYDWIFGPDSDPASSAALAPGTIRYVSPGPKDITLTVTNLLRPECTTSITRSIDIILPPLTAKFDVNPKFACVPATFQVSTDPSVTEITGDLIEWTVIDQNNRVVATSSGVYPSFSIPFAGEYEVRLTASSTQTGQTVTATPVPIVVYEKPLASFEARPEVVFVPDGEMRIDNHTGSPSEIQFGWDFGDGDVLTAPAAPSADMEVPGGTHNGRTKGTYEEPIHTYKIEGIYDLTMIASQDHGGAVCSDTLIVKVQGRQGGVARVPNAFTPNRGGSGSSGGAGTGNVNDVFLPYVKGVDSSNGSYNLQIYDRWGNLIFESTDSTVGWNGTDATGKMMPSGVYVYKLSLLLSDGQRSTQIGDVTMIY